MKSIALALALSSAAFAQEAQVDVQAQVVVAVVAGNQLDPASLVSMQQALSKKVKYGSLKQVSTSKLTLKKAAQTLALPNKKSAQVSLEKLEKDVATVRVKLSPSDTTYKLGRDGSLYLQAGAFEGGELWLVLSQPK